MFQIKTTKIYPCLTDFILFIVMRYIPGIIPCLSNYYILNHHNNHRKFRLCVFLLYDMAFLSGLNQFSEGNLPLVAFVVKVVEGGRDTVGRKLWESED